MMGENNSVEKRKIWENKGKWESGKEEITNVKVGIMCWREEGADEEGVVGGGWCKWKGDGGWTNGEMERECGSKNERPSLRGEERYYGWVRRERNLIQTKKKKTGGNWYRQEKWVSIGSDKCAVAYNFSLHSLQFVFQCPVRPYVLPFLQSSVPLIVGQIQM